MVRSNPGYIPYDYKYDMKKMSQRDLLIYDMLKTAIYSTIGQQREMFGSKGFKHGSFSHSYTRNDLSGRLKPAPPKMTFSGAKCQAMENRLSVT